MARPWFSFKGIRSDDPAHYLHIEELPHTTRPKERGEYVEIEGRDGEEFISHGYAAYDKPLAIGPKDKNPDVDYFIHWLQGSGQLVLSDEPDKYYDARIIDQIDFTRLIRLRRASVVFRVQPWKHLLSEIESLGIDGEPVTVTNLGYAVSCPVITIHGSGDVGLYIAGAQVCQLALGTDDQITINSEAMQAYSGTFDTLRNRDMTGAFPELAPGPNLIETTGTVTRIEIIPRSRWL